MPNRLARSLVTRRTGTVALVVSDSESHDDDPFMGRFFADPYFGRVVGGLMSVLRQAGVQLALQIVGTEDGAQAARRRPAATGRPTGSIVLSLPADDPLPRHAHRRRRARRDDRAAGRAGADQLRRPGQRHRRRAGRGASARARLPAASA